MDLVQELEKTMSLMRRTLQSHSLLQLDYFLVPFYSQDSSEPFSI